MSRPVATFPFSTDGVEIAQKDTLTLVSGSRGFISVGVSGSTTKFISVDESGRQIFVGSGVPGTPSGGIVTIQGISGSTNINTLANQGSQGTHSSRWMIGISDGSNFISPAIDRATAVAPASIRLSDGTNFYDATKTGQLPSTLVDGRLDVTLGTSIPAGTNNIGDVDILSVPAPLSTSGGGVEASALRVTIASDSTGLVSIDDNSGSITTDTPQLPNSLVSGRLDNNIGSWFGSTLPFVGQKIMSSSIPVTFSSDQSPIQVLDANAAGTSPTFFAIYDRIAPATNKYMALLFNTSVTKKLVVYRINRYNWQVAAVTGQTLEQYLVKISEYTAGTSSPIRTTDSADSLPSGITSVTNPATVTEEFLIRRLFASSEEANLSNANFYNALTLDYSVSIYERTVGTRGLVLRTNEGLAIRNVTNSTAGTVSYIIEFIVEDI